MTMRNHNDAVVAVPDRRNINDNYNNDEDDDRLLFTLTMLPVPLLILIVNNLGTQEDLINMSVLSKQMHMIVHLPAIETKIIRIYEISPSSSIKNNRGSESSLLRRLVYNRLHNNEKFSQYHHLRLSRINEFDKDLTVTDRDEIMNNVPPFYNFESLDLSLLPYSSSMSSSAFGAYGHVLYALRNLLQNVQEINLSHVRINRRMGPLRMALQDFFQSLSSLQKITWNHCERVLDLSGDPFGPTNTKELFLDDSIFVVDAYITHVMSDLEDDDVVYMFHQCRSLERLSIRNAKYTTNLSDDNIDDVDILQNILVKFVRNAPSSMRWFRSDLTTVNMTMLQKERPEIQLLN